MNKYTYNKNYFEVIDTHDKAYWLGFLYADGCVHELYNKDKTKIKSMRLAISLCETDYYHLEKFKKCIDANIPIKKRSTILNGKTFYYFQIIISCTKLCRDLIDKGCTPRKTYAIKFPNSDIVPHEFMKDFLRGLFDGDGCLNYVPKVRLECNITGMKNMLSDTNDYLLSNNIISRQLKIYDRKNSLACEMWLYGDTCKSFLDYIYKDSITYLDRKYNKYLQYCNDHQRIMEKGVYWSNRNKAYIVTISIHSKRIRIGQYKNYEDAVKARKEAEINKLQNPQALLVSNG